MPEVVLAAIGFMGGDEKEGTTCSATGYFGLPEAVVEYLGDGCSHYCETPRYQGPWLSRLGALQRPR